MRTTVDIEEDILLAAKEIARLRGITLGRVLSDLARQSLTRKSPTSIKHGLPQFPIQPGAGIVTAELVNQLRDELPYGKLATLDQRIPVDAVHGGRQAIELITG